MKWLASSISRLILISPKIIKRQMSYEVSETSGLAEVSKIKLSKAEKKAKYRQDYPEPLKSRRELLKEEFMNNEGPKEERIQNIILKFFDEDLENNLNIYGSVVDHFLAMPDRTRHSEKNLASIFLKSFKIWIDNREDKEELKKKFLTRQIQIQAHKSCSGASYYLDFITELFDLDSNDLSEMLIADIKEKLSMKEFKEAAEIVINYNLKSLFTFEEIILPLILQDRLQTVYEYLKGMPELQKEFVRWNDNLIAKSEQKIEYELEKWSDIMTVPYSKFFGKTQEKFMKSFFNKIVKEFEFDINCSLNAPNYEIKKQEKALKHHISTRYDEKSKIRQSDDVYFQNIRPTLETCLPKITEEFLFYLWSSNNREKQIDAISWIKLLNLDISSRSVPRVIKEYFESSNNRSMIQEADWLMKNRLESAIPEKGKQLFLFENDPENRIQIIMVSTNAGLEQLCSELKFFENDENEENEKFVGIDTEWKPSHLINSTDMKIAIMQIFIGKKVFIVDCVKMEEDELIKESIWIKFANRLLASKKLKIIGFDLLNDLDALLTMKSLRNNFKIENVKNVYCLKKLTENIYDIDINLLSLPRRTFKLADLTEKLLNLTLNKNEQCSNWQSRPLRLDQIIYAAMDSYVVVAIFKKILNIVRNDSRNFIVEDFIKESDVLLKKKESNKKENRKLDTLEWKEIYEALKDHRNLNKQLKRPYEVKCIVDTMLLGFGKFLRRCGIDVIIPKDVQDFNEKLKTMKRLGGEHLRYILTVPSKSHQSLMGQFPELTKAFADISQKSALDQLKMFFDEFNIDLKSDDICLRCVNCNSRFLTRFPSPVIHFLHQYLIIHLQNVYRLDMSEFPLDEWYRKMEELNPDDYNGIKVKMSRPSEESDWIVATTSEGCLHITRNVILHNNCVEGVDVRVNKVPDDVFQRPNLIFYVCGECGKVMYDGKKVTNSDSTSASNSLEKIVE